MTFSACAYALKCLVDPDLPVNDGFYRLVHARCTRGDGDQLHVARPGGRRLGDADAPRRGDVPRAPARLPGPTSGGHEGDDVPGRLRLARRRRRELHRASTTPSPGGYGGRHASDGPDAVQAHGQNTENAPVEETELNYPVSIDRLALVEDSEGPGRFRGGLGLRKDYRFDLHTTFTVLADRDRDGPWGAAGGRSGRVAEYVHVRDGVETPHRLEEHDRPRPGRRDQHPQLRRRRLRAAGASATPSACCATCSKERSASSGRATSTGSRSRIAASTRPQPPSCGEPHERRLDGATRSAGAGFAGTGAGMRAVSRSTSEGRSPTRP